MGDEHWVPQAGDDGRMPGLPLALPSSEGSGDSLQMLRVVGELENPLACARLLTLALRRKRHGEQGRWMSWRCNNEWCFVPPITEPTGLRRRGALAVADPDDRLVRRHGVLPPDAW